MNGLKTNLIALPFQFLLPLLANQSKFSFDRADGDIHPPSDFFVGVAVQLCLRDIARRPHPMTTNFTSTAISQCRESEIILIRRAESHVKPLREGAANELKERRFGKKCGRKKMKTAAPSPCFLPIIFAKTSSVLNLFN